MAVTKIPAQTKATKKPKIVLPIDTILFFESFSLSFMLVIIKTHKLLILRELPFEPTEATN